VEIRLTIRLYGERFRFRTSMFLETEMVWQHWHCRLWVVHTSGKHSVNEFSV